MASRTSTQRETHGHYRVSEAHADDTQSRPATLPDQLSQLSRLHRDGDLTALEFSRAKTEILRATSSTASAVANSAVAKSEDSKRVGVATAELLGALEQGVADQSPAAHGGRRVEQRNAEKQPVFPGEASTLEAAEAKLLDGLAAIRLALSTPGEAGQRTLRALLTQQRGVITNASKQVGPVNVQSRVFRLTFQAVGDAIRTLHCKDPRRERQWQATRRDAVALLLQAGRAEEANGAGRTAEGWAWLLGLGGDRGDAAKPEAGMPALAAALPDSSLFDAIDVFTGGRPERWRTFLRQGPSNVCPTWCAKHLLWLRHPACGAH